MSKALYRKYRSKKLPEIVGQEHITTTLSNAIKSGKISHAYLFTGPRGVGKTSIARILAHEINNIEYTEDSFQLDIIEIDAASNRRIDEIRDLRDKVHIAPTSSKYKVYIIDEVHMLTREAFNALLKTLEEPPKHVVFILATTEVNKLPETIISRTQKFTFRPIYEEDAIKHLESIAKSEKIEIDKDAIKLLAKHGNGSFRDSISLLDQVRSINDKKISKQDVEMLIGIVPAEHVENIIEKTLKGKPSDIVATLDKITEDGIAANQIAKQLSRSIRELFISNSANKNLLTLLEDLINVPNSPEPASALEVALIRANLEFNQESIVSPTKINHSKQNSEPKKTKEAVKEQKVAETNIKEDKTEIIQEEKIDITELEDISSLEWWDDVLKNIKSINNTLHGVLRMAQVSINEDTIIMSFKFAFHKNKISDPETQSKIHEVIKNVTGKSFTIKSVHDKDVDNQTKNQNNPDKNTGSISSITNVFGGGEVLET